jgi:hypothetical protein
MDGYARTFFAGTFGGAPAEAPLKLFLLAFFKTLMATRLGAPALFRTFMIVSLSEVTANLTLRPISMLTKARQAWEPFDKSTWRFQVFSSYPCFSQVYAPAGTWNPAID